MSDTQRAQVAPRNFDLAMTKRKEPGIKEGIKEREEGTVREEEGIKGAF
jgi:hypothetical protein